MRPSDERAFENIERGQLAGLFDTQTTLDEQFEQRPVPEGVDLVGPRIATRGERLGISYCGLPSLQRKGANLGHLAFEIENRSCDASTRTFARLFEAVPAKGVTIYWNRAGGKGGKRRIGLGCPGADVGKECAANSTSQEYAVPGTSSPVPGPRWTDRARATA